MSTVKDTFKEAFAKTESFFDRLKLGYKWRFDRWKDLRIEPYRGFGTRDALYLRGRVLDDKASHLDEQHTSRFRNIVSTIRRLETDEIPGARVRATFGDLSCEAETDKDGFFELVLRPDGDLPTDCPWHEVHLELLAPEDPDGDAITAVCEVVVPQDDVEYGIISDLDDTVVRTGAQSRLRMTAVVMLNNAKTRAPFEGVGAFYDALQKGPDARGHNPVFYVSSSPWNLYGLFEDFMEAHGIPHGPIFLKDFGFEKQHFMSSGHQQHKLERVEQLLKTYPELPFLLIGDSGQEDPEIYREVVRRHPGRIRAIFIRDVTHDDRDAEVRGIAEALEAEGVPMFLAENTAVAATKAAGLGLITEEAVGRVESQKQEEETSQKVPHLLEKLL